MLIKNDYGFLTFVKRQHFNDNKGRDLLAVVAAACDTGVETDAKDAYLALACFHALVKYGDQSNPSMLCCATPLSPTSMIPTRLSL